MVNALSESKLHQLVPTTKSKLNMVVSFLVKTQNLTNAKIEFSLLSMTPNIVLSTQMEDGTVSLLLVKHAMPIILVSETASVNVHKCLADKDKNASMVIVLSENNLYQNVPNIKYGLNMDVFNLVRILHLMIVEMFS